MLLNNYCFGFFQHRTDDSWLNLSEQDLDNILSKYSDQNSRHKETENGTLSGGNTGQSDVGIIATYTI